MEFLKSLGIERPLDASPVAALDWAVLIGGLAIAIVFARDSNPKMKNTGFAFMFVLWTSLWNPWPAFAVVPAGFALSAVVGVFAANLAESRATRRGSSDLSRKTPDQSVSH